MKIGVTGGTGFTGAALVKRLLDAGHEVRTIDKNPGIELETLQHKGAETELASVTDRAAVARAVAGAEVVFHIAAAFREIGVPDTLYKDVNVEGTRIVLEETQKAGARKLVYCSTIGVHGNIDQPPGDENSPIAPADYYQQTKYEGEQVVRERAGDLEYTIIRPTAIYGPGDPERYSMIYRRVNKGLFPMFGNGKTFYHPVYIDNLVDAFLLAMEPGKGSGEAYIIGDEHYLSIEELVRGVGKALNVKVSVPHLPILPLIVAGHTCERVCKPLGVAPPIFPRRVDWFRQMRAFRIDKARNELGYNPLVGIDEGLQRTGDWYRANGYI
jgi:nucleoside-diphosphate-sugar epimerase